MTPEALHDLHNSTDNDGRTRWKYLVKVFGDGEFQENLSILGAVGWELVTVNYYHPDPRMNYTRHDNLYTAILKMPYWLEQSEQTDE